MGPLQNIEQWDDFVAQRYQPDKKQEDFRKYDDATPPGVREFYRLNHTHQTVEFVREKKHQYLAKGRGVVGDTFPVGCAYSDKIVFPEYFRDNPDSKIPRYQTRLGIYSEGCGLEHV